MTTIVAGIDAGGTLTAGSLQAYYFSLSANRWSRAPDLDLTVAAGMLQPPAELYKPECDDFAI